MKDTNTILVPREVSKQFPKEEGWHVCKNENLKNTNIVIGQNNFVEGRFIHGANWKIEIWYEPMTKEAYLSELLDGVEGVPKYEDVQAECYRRFSEKEDSKAVVFHQAAEWTKQQMFPLLAKSEEKYNSLKRGFDIYADTIVKQGKELARKDAEAIGFAEWLRQYCYEPYQEGWSLDKGVIQIETSKLFYQYQQELQTLKSK